MIQVMRETGEVDDGPQQVHPALGVAQAPEEPTARGGSRLGLEVAAGYRLAPVHARYGEAGEVGEAPGDAQVDDEQQQPHPDDGGDHTEGGQWPQAGRRRAGSVAR